MALIASPRHTREDLQVWADRERLDATLYRSGATAQLESAALDALAAFLAVGDPYVGVSWGKDSLVLAHLVYRLRSGRRVIWCPAGSIENPDCTTVRDRFLKRFGIRYEEHPAPLTSDDWDRSIGHDGAQQEFERVTRALGNRYASGVRAQENSQRALAVAVHGVSSRNTCRPLAHWRIEHVFAYIVGHDLPVHPAYACSFGGVLDRSAIRVGTIGGTRGTGRGRAEWERRYYPEVAR